MKRFFNILLCVISFFVFAQNVQAKTIEFIQIADLHLVQTDSSIKNFEHLINSVNSMDNLDFVVFTGDNLDKPDVQVLDIFLKMCKNLKVPYYIQIGNHDCLKANGLTKSIYIQKVKENSVQNFKSFNFVVKRGNTVFLFLDGTKELLPTRRGYFNDETLAWLDKQLTKYMTKNVIIFQHYPLIDESEGSSHNLYMSQKYWEVLAKHKNVKAVFSGHYHVAREEIVNNILHVTTPTAKEDVRYIRDVIVNDKGKNKEFDIYSSVLNY